MATDSDKVVFQVGVLEGTDIEWAWGRLVNV